MTSPSPTVRADGPAGQATESFLSMIADARFPCVGAKSALANDAIEVREFARLGSRCNDAPLLDALSAFAARLDAPGGDRTLASFAAIFHGPDDTDELRFEALLWAQLQRLHELDVRRGARWDPQAAREPGDPRFSLSLAGRAFFVVGLHAGASRTARRFEWPVLVFNPHAQFERLRADGRFAKMQAAIRRRELALQGSINPNLADFGDVTEARQYSGRAVPRDWTCPFRQRSRE